MKVKITKSAKKEISKLDKNIKKKVYKEINLLRQGKSRIIRLKGSGNEGKIRVAGYRIRFSIDKENNLIRITGVPKRKEAYRNL